MRAGPEALVVGAEGAARAALASLHAGGAAASDAASVDRASDAAPPLLALLVSCVGRRLVLRQRTEEELEAVHDVLAGAGRTATVAGFYSCGKIAPAGGRDARGALHNQTMTVTLLDER